MLRFFSAAHRARACKNKKTFIVAALVVVIQTSRFLSAETTSAGELMHQSDQEQITVTGTAQCGQLYVGLTVLHTESTTQPQTTTLSVHVIRADSLPPREFSGTCDPYVKVRYGLVSRAIK